MNAPIRTIRIQGNGARNLVDPQAILALHEALVDFDADDSAHVAILTGNTDHFWGGADLSAMRAAFDDMSDLKGKLRHFTFPLAQDVPSPLLAWRRLFRWKSSKPVIAAIAGDCFDLGMVLLGVHSDLRIAEETSRFGFPAVQNGNAAGEALASGLQRQIAPAALNWMVETGEPIDAAAAHRAWLVNRVVAPGEALAAAFALAERVATVPLATLRCEKLSTRLAWSVEQDEAILAAIAYARAS